MPRHTGKFRHAYGLGPLSSRAIWMAVRSQQEPIFAQTVPQMVGVSVSRDCPMIFLVAWPFPQLRVPLHSWNAACIPPVVLYPRTLRLRTFSFPIALSVPLLVVGTAARVLYRR